MAIQFAVALLGFLTALMTGGVAVAALNRRWQVADRRRTEQAFQSDRLEVCERSYQRLYDRYVEQCQAVHVVVRIREQVRKAEQAAGSDGAAEVWDLMLAELDERRDLPNELEAWRTWREAQT